MWRSLNDPAGGVNDPDMCADVAFRLATRTLLRCNTAGLPTFRRTGNTCYIEKNLAITGITTEAQYDRLMAMKEGY
jgi:hypothetical protein